jgi:NAD(P)-dependent dehydrogenase (short-subunit alcohol dehydrogenase family)
MDRLEGKVAASTGGASGIGAGTVRRFVEEGAKVLIADLDQAKGDALATELGSATAFLRTDVSKEADIVAMVAETTDRFGRIDVLLKSVFQGIKHVAPLMKALRSGSIISTASVAGIRAGYAPHLYSVAKCAVIHLTRTVALELGEHGIRVNAICPGFVATPLAAGRPDADETQIDGMRTAAATAQVLGRVGEPLDIANMALFLASDDSPWITGQDFVVDGGFEAGPPWSRWPKFARMERPIRHHRPPDR